MRRAALAYEWGTHPSGEQLRNKFSKALPLGNHALLKQIHWNALRGFEVGFVFPPPHVDGNLMVGIKKAHGSCAAVHMCPNLFQREF